jgi:hypothetical protein
VAEQNQTEATRSQSKSASRHAAVAALIRAKLKKHGIPGSVRSKSYSGGESVTVSIDSDILPATRKAIEAFAHGFQYGHFDGMTDSYEYSNSREDVPQVRFVFVNVNYSDALVAAAKEYAGDAYWPALNGVWGSFWRDRKPRTRAEAVR